MRKLSRRRSAESASTVTSRGAEGGCDTDVALLLRSVMGKKIPLNQCVDVRLFDCYINSVHILNVLRCLKGNISFGSAALAVGQYPVSREIISATWLMKRLH